MTKKELEQLYKYLIGTNSVPVLKYPKAFVYALLDGDEIVYIGKTISGIARIYSHMKNKDFDGYAILDHNSFCKDEEYFIEHIKEYESLVILLLNPKYNKTISTQEHFCTLSVLINEYKLSDNQIVQVIRNAEEYYCSDKPYYNKVDVFNIINGEQND